MARQKEDKHTLQLDGIPKAAGRPSTGRALSPKQRQAKYRAKLKAEGKTKITLTADERDLILRCLTTFDQVDDFYPIAFSLIQRLQPTNDD